MKKEQVQERILHPANGYLMLLLGILLLIAGIGGGVAGSVIGGMEENGALIAISVTACVILVILGVILLCGLKVLNPNEAYVLTLFGNYYGTIKKEGFFWVNPFCSAINPTVKAVPVATGNVERTPYHRRRICRRKESVSADDDPGQQEAEGQRSAGQSGGDRSRGDLAGSGSYQGCDQRGKL